MISIYQLRLADGQEWVLPRVLEDNLILLELRGQCQLHWSPIVMDVLTKDEDGVPRGYSDFPWYGNHVLVLRSSAADSLRGAMQPYGQFLPLKGAERLELFNGTTVLDALDENLSEITRFDDGSILNIDRYVFRPEAIGNSPIFKLPYRASNLYMHGKFIEQIERLGLSGIGFELVWSDEAEPIREVIFPPLDQFVGKRRWWWR